MQELKAVVSGRVQMVMMRDFVQRTASRLGLVGYVQNLPDGTVEVVAQGGRTILDELVAALHKGSLLSRVDSVQVLWREPSAAYDSFQIEY